MRLAKKKCILLYAAGVCFVFLFVLKLNSLSSPSSSSSSSLLRSSGHQITPLDSDCKIPEEVNVNLRLVMAETDRVLKSLSLTHPLCYGTLWGWLKMSNLLPWMDTVVFCVLNEELAKYEEAFLMRSFRRAHLSLVYDSQDGVYEVRSARKSPNMNNGWSSSIIGGAVRLVVFEKNSVMSGESMRRIGWSRRVLPADCELSPSLHCFPARLLEEPLPNVIIDDVQYQVPREEVEIQKYLYPDTWWEDVRPPQCTTNGPQL